MNTLEPDKSSESTSIKMIYENNYEYNGYDIVPAKNETGNCAIWTPEDKCLGDSAKSLGEARAMIDIICLFQ